VVMPKTNYSNMRCVFQDKQTQLCMLHDLDAKPLECRLANCQISKWIFLNIEDEKKQNKHGNRIIIEDMWNTDKGRQVVKKFCISRGMILAKHHRDARDAA